MSETCDLVYFDGTEARGASNVGVLVKHGSKVRMTSFRVWIPELPLDVVLSDNRLSAITGLKIASTAARSVACWLLLLINLGDKVAIKR